MRCVVVCDWNAWDFDNVVEARRWYKTLVDYAKSGRTDEGEPSEFVQLWKSVDYYNDDGFSGPIKEWYGN